jgi:hypothetical protein
VTTRRAVASGRVLPTRCWCGRKVTTMSTCGYYCVEHDDPPPAPKEPKP